MDAALFFTLTGVRSRSLLSSVICISLMFYFIAPEYSLPRYWLLNDRHPISEPILTVYIILSVASIILGVFLNILAFCIPEIPVYVVGAIGAGLSFELLGLGSLDASFGIPLFWLIRTIEGALWVACVWFSEPYAMIVEAQQLSAPSSYAEPSRTLMTPTCS